MKYFPNNMPIELLQNILHFSHNFFGGCNTFILTYLKLFITRNNKKYFPISPSLIFGDHYLYIFSTVKKVHGNCATWVSKKLNTQCQNKKLNKLMITQRFKTTNCFPMCIVCLHNDITTRSTFNKQGMQMYNFVRNLQNQIH